ncbi:hypothetical protein KR76_23030 [Pimelobacter simplex]|uniref:Uncharacterized protein n=1 Tax=Nocardioides simplex TaxID=2045 RepID=A0A0A1DQR7_NOCSI|nr:hypothetical protein KR76_23030 [Pimelobacter simplex]
MYTKNGYVKNHTYYKDLAPGGNGVYTQTDYQYLVKKPSDGTVGWSLTFHQDQSARTTSSSWQDQYDSDDYTSRSQEGSVRVWYKVCEDQSMSPDACSRNPYIRVNGL